MFWLCYKVGVVATVSNSSKYHLCIPANMLQKAHFKLPEPLQTHPEKKITILHYVDFLRVC